MFPVADVFRHTVIDWVEYLRNEKLWGLADPLFPATQVAQDAQRQFAVTGLDHKHWSNASPIRAIFKAAFQRAGLPYFNPHSFRKTLVILSEKVCKTPEEFKAWSQNLGHEDVMTTFISYGPVARNRQAEIMRELGAPRNPALADEDRLRQIVEEVYRANAGHTG